MTTQMYTDRRPPLRPRRVGSKIAVSCEKPRQFLIRAWCPAHSSPERPINWILHHLGRLDLADLEWWGFTYPGQPPYMGGTRDRTGLSSGLTIQRFVPPSHPWTLQSLDEGRIGPVYGEPEDLEIPERGHYRIERVS
jgi:hypothetical protein